MLHKTLEAALKQGRHTIPFAGVLSALGLAFVGGFLLEGPHVGGLVVQLQLLFFLLCVVAFVLCSGELGPSTLRHADLRLVLLRSASVQQLRMLSFL